MNNPVENEDYIVIEHPQKNVQWSCVKLLKKPYENVIIQFGRLKFSEKENDDGSLDASFEREIIDTANVSSKVLETEKFNNMLGDILIDILQNYLNEREVDEIQPVGDDDTEGTDL